MTAAIPDAPAIGVGRLLKDDTFVVPSHQRDYKWSQEHVGQLFDDVEEALRDRSPVYFVGLMVILRRPDNIFVVLDGQQRLATTIIIFSAIRNWLYGYDQFRKDGDRIQEWFIGQGVLGSDRMQPTLTMNAVNNSIFYDYVVKYLPYDDIRSARDRLKRQDPNRTLLDAVLYAHDRVRQIAAVRKNPEEAARFFFNFVTYLQNNVTVVKLTVTSEGAAYTIFETLNDRGLDLSPLDLVKNHLYSRAAQIPNRLREMEARWVQMMATLANVSADDFLKAFWTSRHGRIRKPQLFETFKRTYSDSEKAVEVSQDMARAAEQYAALETSDDPEWATYPERIRPTVRSLKLLGTKQAHPAMLAAMAKMEPREVERLFRLIEVITVRYVVIGEASTGRLETAWAVLARKIYNGDVSTATDCLANMREYYPDDDEFRRRFAEKSEENQQKVLYFLKGIERQARQQQLGALADQEAVGENLTVEHILPRHPGPEWADEIARDENLVEEWTARLGNLCLLPKAHNKDLGRAGFAEKRMIYEQNEKILTTYEIAEYASWGRQPIAQRQLRMARLAVQRWRFQ